MKKLAFLGGAVALSALALTQAPLTSHAADHLDAPAVKMAANAMADLNDLYAWMTTDGAKVNLALTFSPLDPGTRTFGPTVQYVFHVNSRPGTTTPMITMPGVESRVICTFASNTDGQCWVVSPTGTVLDYVKGDFSATAGKSAPSGKFKVFAGRRSDPFFFNFGGFALAQAQAETACGGSCPGALPVDAAGCPTIDAATANSLRTKVVTAPPAMVGPCAANQIDCFKPYNVMAIVIEVDKTLLLAGSDHYTSIWASTHAGS